MARQQSVSQNAYNQTLTQLKNKQQELGQKTEQTVQNVVGCISVGLVTMFFVSNPIFYLIFFSFAIFSGIDGITQGINYWLVSSEISGNEEKMKTEQKKLEADLNSKNLAFQQAINNMEIRVHLVLQEVIELFYKLDNVPFFPIDVNSEVLHCELVIGFLKQTGYRAKVPIEYHCFLDLVTEGN